MLTTTLSLQFIKN